MNNNNNNFSLIRNSEINRLCPLIRDHSFEKYDINEKMKKMSSYEEIDNENYLKPIWKRKNYNYVYCNEIINPNYKKQYCIIGIETLKKNYDKIKELYEQNDNDFILLDNKYDSNDDTICNELDRLKFDKMKCYSMKDCSKDELIKFFHLIYKSCDNYELIC